MHLVTDKNGKYIGLGDIDFSAVEAVYAPDNDNRAVQAFFSANNFNKIYDDSVLDGDENKLTAAIKRDYNCLRTAQNILLLDRDCNVLYSVPQAAIIFSENKINTPLSESNSNILSYLITKDLFFLNEYIKGKPTDLLEKIQYTTALLSNSKYEKLQNNYLESLYLKDKEREQEKIRDWVESVENKAKTECSPKRNLVLIHLESISDIIYTANKHLLENLTRLMSQSVQLNKYFSPATSTLMAVSAVLYGNDFELDSFVNYGDIILGETHSQNLFQTLNNSGYCTMGLYGAGANIANDFNTTKIWNDGNSDLHKYDTHGELISTIESALENLSKSQSRTPFALFIDNEFTHCGSNDIEIEQGVTFEEKMLMSYKSLDDTIKTLYAKLEQTGALENTIIVAYGDHGDDKWTRGINNGFSHTVEPYLSVIKTPAFIFDRRTKPFCINKLVSGTDLKATMLYLLGFDYKDKFAHSGVNILKENNAHVYSSTLFANQSCMEIISSNEMMKLHGFDRAEIKTKAFSVTNDEFSLVASDRGMELFNILSDPYNYNNLLTFFEFDANGCAVKFNNYGAWRGHFRQELMNDTQICNTLNNFYTLRQQLKERILIKNSFIVSETKHLFDMDNFLKVRKRGFDFS